MLLPVLSFLLLVAQTAASSFLWQQNRPVFTEESAGEPQSFPLPYFPLAIQDRALAEGAKLQVFTSADHIETIQLPKKKVFLPFPFFLEVKKKGFPEPLFLRVHPQITHGFSFDVERRGDFGLVFNVDYRDAVSATFLDVLNEIDRRDLHLLARKKQNGGEFTGISIRNAFSNQNPRKVDLFQRKRLSPSLLVDLRLDNVSRRHGIDFGSNLVFQKGKNEFLLGNVHHKVENDLAFQARRDFRWGNVKLRMEHFALRKEPGFSGRGLFVQRLGGQVNVYRGGFYLRAGNLKVERVLQDLEEGKVDSRFNFEAGHSLYWGSPFFGLQKAWAQSGEVGVSVVGFGSDYFLRGHLFQDFYFARVYEVNLRLFSDFVRLGGESLNPPFHRFRLTFLRQRDFFDRTSLLAKWGLSFVFAEAEWQRRGGKEYSFFSRPDLRVGVGKDLGLYRFAIPLELGIEWQKRKDLRFFFQISTRAWL